MNRAQLMRLINDVQIQLNKVKSYKWGKEADSINWRASQIFNIDTYENLIHHIEKHKLNYDQSGYLICRWFNAMCAKVSEEMFMINNKVSRPDCRLEKNDFYIQNIGFDLKDTIVPKDYHFKYKGNFIQLLTNIYNNPKDILRWFYLNQSKTQRYGLNNRIFIINYDIGNHKDSWKIKRDFLVKYKAISFYLNHFSINNMIKINLSNTDILTDIIMILKGNNYLVVFPGNQQIELCQQLNCKKINKTNWPKHLHITKTDL